MNFSTSRINLREQIFLVAPPSRLHLVVNIPRDLKNDLLESEPLRQRLQVNLRQDRQVRLARHDRGHLRIFDFVRRVEHERLDLFQIQFQLRAVNVVNADDVRPANQETNLLPRRFNPRFWRRRRQRAIFPPSCGRKVNGTPKMFTYSGSNNSTSSPVIGCGTFFAS